MDKIFDKELENWVKTLNEAQIIELDKFETEFRGC